MSASQTMRQQLSTMRDQIITKKRNELKDPALSPMRWKGDGIDHINIWEHGDTELGLFLAHSSPYEFNHKIFGRFSSMESFWHYIQSVERDDRIRVMRGPTLRRFSKKLEMVKVHNFRAIIMDSNWQRIRQYRDQMEQIANSTLPFDCYYINKDTHLKVRPTFFKWLIMGFEEIRSALKEGREPIFDFLLDNTKTDIYEFVMPNLEKRSPKSSALSKEEAAAIINSLEQNLGSVIEVIETT